MGLHLSVVMPVYNERFLVAEAIRRVLAVASPHISRLDLIVVDDGSTDGTREILRGIATANPERVTYLEHEHNQGKGGAVRSGIALARGDVTVIQDSDLEYDPEDLPRLMVPFLRHSADAVFGSRFLSGEHRRVLYYRHTLGNKLLTTIANVLTDLNLTDMETCYKAVRTPLLQSIPLRSHDFRIEPELVFKLTKRGARIYEVPISYSGRTYEEGKKIGPRDAWYAFWTMLHWWLVDDIYKDDKYGSEILARMANVPNFNRWMADVVRPYLGASVLEIGAGIGNMTRRLAPRDRYTATDINPHYLDYLRGSLDGRPYLDVRKVDLTERADFAALPHAYDTVVCLNVLEHVGDEALALANLHSALAPGGCAIVLVPQGPALMGSLDDVLGHERRYTRAALRSALEAQGFSVEALFDFNRVTTPAWWWNGKVLRRKHFSRLQLKLLNVNTWWIRRLDPYLPWKGTSLIAIARRS
jgi:glycosyltransferase involved in cell wall biosynthesis